jgi:hypothetical protein
MQEVIVLFDASKTKGWLLVILVPLPPFTAECKGDVSRAV